LLPWKLEIDACLARVQSSPLERFKMVAELFVQIMKGMFFAQRRRLR